jgi:hypothetical protein
MFVKEIVNHRVRRIEMGHWYKIQVSPTVYSRGDSDALGMSFE